MLFLKTCLKEKGKTMGTEKNTMQKIFTLFEVLLFLGVYAFNVYLYIQNDNEVCIVALLVGVVLLYLVWKIPRFAIHIILYVAVILLIFSSTGIFAPHGFLDTTPHIYFVAYRDNTIKMFDECWAFIPPLSYKKIYHIPKSETREMEVKVNKVLGKFIVTINVSIADSLTDLTAGDIESAIKNIQGRRGFFKNCFGNFILYTPHKELWSISAEADKGSFFFAHFSPQKFETGKIFFTSWTGKMEITSLKINLPANQFYKIYPTPPE